MNEQNVFNSPNFRCIKNWYTRVFFFFNNKVNNKWLFKVINLSLQETRKNKPTNEGALFTVNKI